jgi:hypothetical protein
MHATYGTWLVSIVLGVLGEHAWLDAAMDESEKNRLGGEGYR